MVGGNYYWYFLAVTITCIVLVLMIFHVRFRFVLGSIFEAILARLGFTPGRIGG